MRVINVKKLIVSTLLFLFTSYHQQILADSVDVTTVPSVLQESTFTATPPNVDLAAPRIGPNFAIHTPQMDAANIQKLFNALPTFDHTTLQTDEGKYSDNQSVSVFLSGQDDVPVGHVTPEFVPQVLSMKGHDGNFIILPQFTASSTKSQLIDLEILLLTFYLAFRAVKMLKRNEVHTALWQVGNQSPQVVGGLQYLAASLAAIDALTFHVNQDESRELLAMQGELQAYKGKRVDEILEKLITR